MNTNSTSWITSLSSGIIVAAAMLAACSSDSGGAAGTGGAGGNVGVVECTGSTAITDRPGFERCAEDIEHRVSAEQCNAPAPSQCQGKQGCQSNADCTDNPNGHCIGTLPPGGNCSCTYGCAQDSDCAAGQLCQCGSPVGRCVTAQCRTDADCGSGKLCVETLFDGCSRGYACQTDADECSRGTCGPAQPPGNEIPACVMTGGKRSCKEVNICCITPSSCA